jgi:hypothetical protein
MDLNKFAGKSVMVQFTHPLVLAAVTPGGMAPVFMQGSNQPAMVPCATGVLGVDGENFSVSFPDVQGQNATVKVNFKPENVIFVSEGETSLIQVARPGALVQ